MVKARAGQRIRKEIGISGQVGMVRATYSEIKEDLRSMGFDESSSRCDTNHKKKTFPVKRIISAEEENAALEGLTQLIFVEDETNEEIAPQQNFQQNLTVIPQGYQRFGAKDIDIVKTRNSSVHIRIGYTILTHNFMAQNFST